MKSLDSKRQFLVVMLCGSCMTVLILLIMSKDYPLVGHDFRYFIPHLIDTEMHIQLHGLSIQWYTPSFGGGLPAFPNPQHIEYSIVQLLSMILNPWAAILLSTAGVSLAGYYFFYRFLNEILGLNWMASILGGLFWIGNGFYIEHLIGGMLGYQLLPLGAIILYALADKRHTYLYNACIIAIVIALIMHQAGFYLILILLLSFGMALPILSLYKPFAINPKSIMLTGLAAFILSGAMAASKVYATFAFMRFFPRIVADTFTVGYFPGILGIVAQLFGVMSFAPLLVITQQNPEYLSGALSNMIGTKYGIWETDVALSPILIIFLFMGTARLVSQVKGFRIKGLSRPTLLKYLLLLLFAWLTLEMTLAKGILYSVTKQLPILRSLHINCRFAAAFMLPLIILGTVELHRYFLRNPKLVHFSVVALLANLALLSYFSLSNIVYESDFSVDASNSLHAKIQNGMKFPVVEITDTYLDYWTGFSEHSSLYRPYEPIFGYELESFVPETHPGKIRVTSEGFFNMTNPASLVFPEINDLYPFERIRFDEQEKLDVFLERGQPEWKIPAVQKLLNWISLLAAFFCGAVLSTISIIGISPALRRKEFHS